MKSFRATRSSPNWTPDLGQCLRCPPQQVHSIQSSFFASLCQAPEGEVWYFCDPCVQFHRTFFPVLQQGLDVFFRAFPNSRSLYPELLPLPFHSSVNPLAASTYLRHTKR